ncbi:MAG TPA: peptide chain release factor 1 [Nanoarchaeota archaeon]|nr:peptide chain release factor 1 [Nanoarchaeota archaeon]
MSMQQEEKMLKLKKIIEELEKIRGRHTELISLYIPAGYNINEIVSMISQEIALTENVKSKTVRKNVIDALTKILQHLRLYKQTPENGLVIFAGNVAQEEGKSDIKLWAIEPIEPINVKLYWCDQKFELQPLKEQIKEKDVYGLIVLDTKECTIGLLSGKNIKVLKHMESIVPGKFVKGGQSAARFQRVREGLINDWYKKIGEISKELFSQYELKGLLIGGPGISKEHFLDGDYLPTDLKKKVIGIVDTGYTSEHALHELVEKGIEFIKESKYAKEKQLLSKFFSELKKDSGFVTYGLEFVLNALEEGAVEILIISESFEWKEVKAYCQACDIAEKKFVKNNEIPKCPNCKKEMKIIEEMDGIDALEEIAKNYGTQVVIVSRGTREGEQFYNLGGIGAFLRWKIEEI